MAAKVRIAPPNLLLLRITPLPSVDNLRFLMFRRSHSRFKPNAQAASSIKSAIKEWEATNGDARNATILKLCAENPPLQRLDTKFLNTILTKCMYALQLKFYLAFAFCCDFAQCALQFE